MKIFTYYSNVPELDAFNEMKLVTLWRRRWKQFGFEPIVLGEYQARQHPMFSEYDQAVSALPSCNPPGYERSCYLRWLALAQVGGGVMADYDLLPYEDRGRDFKIGDAGIFELLMRCFRTDMPLVMLQERSPSLVCCSANTAVRLCEEFALAKIGNRPQGDKAHFSDQYAIEDLVAQKVDWIELRNDVRNYSDVGWETAPFVHFANDPMARANKLPKWKHIPTLRK